MYRWNPADYHDNASAQTEWARELLSRCRLSGTERVLDMGCGDGTITAEIARQLPGGQVTGLDLSRDMIRYAHDTFPAKEVPNLAFVWADMSHLPFRQAFDLVVANSSLHWVPDQQALLREISRVLRPGGRLVSQTGGKGNAAAILGIFSELMEERDWRKYFRNFPFSYTFCDAAEYQEWLSAAGLHPLVTRLVPKEMVQKGADGLSGWIRTTWHPYLDRLPPGRTEEFIREICVRYIGRHPLDANGQVHVPMVRLEVEAVKRG